MMKRFLASIALSCLTLPAAAADLQLKLQQDAAKVQAAAKQYGFYVGLGAGMAVTNQRFDFISAPGTGDVYPAGAFTGVTFGFGGTAGGFWLGLEGDVNYQFTKSSQNCAAGTCFTRDSWGFDEKVVVGLPLTSLTGAIPANSKFVPPSQWPIPLAMPSNLSAASIMPFVEVGLAQRDVAAGIVGVGEEKRWMNGLLFGGGVRFMLADGWTAKAFYDYTSFRDHFDPAGDPILAGFKAVSMHKAGIGVGYSF